MAFYKDVSKAGMPILMTGVIGIITSAVALVSLFVEMDGSKATLIPTLLTFIGAVIAAIFYIRLGIKVKNKVITDEWEILTKTLLVFGIASLITSLFDIADVVYLKSFTTYSIVTAAIGLFASLVTLLLYWRMTNGKHTIMNKVAYYSVYIVAILCIIVSIMVTIRAFIDVDAFAADRFTFFMKGVTRFILFSVILYIVRSKEIKERAGAS